MTIFLHIGTHKTGSTSIQKFLATAEEALAEQGIIYPKAGRPDTDYTNQYGQHELYWSLVGKNGRQSRQVWRDLVDEIEDWGGDRVVISTEELESCSSQDIERLLDFLHPHSIRVVVYLRNPLHLLVSKYKQRIKMGDDTRSFEGFVEDMVGYCDYQALIARWSQFDRIEDVAVRVFDKVKKDPGLEADFANTIGVDFEPLQDFVPGRTNISPDETTIQFVRWLNWVAAFGGKGGGNEWWL